MAAAPLRVEERQRQVEDGAGGLVAQTFRLPVWIEPLAAGDTPMCRALGHARDVVADFAAAHPRSYPPVVLHITDGEATDGDPLDAARRVQEVTTEDGPALLFNCHLSANRGHPIVFCASEEGLPDAFARNLFAMSSLLPEPLRTQAAREGYGAPPGTRGFAFNADLVELIRFLDIGTRPANQ